MSSKIKVLLVSPYSTKTVGGIGTWTKSILDYNNSQDRVILNYQNTACDIKQKVNYSIVRMILSGADSVAILIRLFINMIVIKPDVVHYTSSAGSALLKDYLAAIIVTKLFRSKFIVHWHFGRIPEISHKKTKEFLRLKEVHEISDASIVLDDNSAIAMNSEGLVNVFVVPNAVTTSVLKCSQSLNMSIVQNERSYNTILFVGQVLKAKGVFELVSACLELKDIVLILIGPDLDNIEAEIYNNIPSEIDKKRILFKGKLAREDIFEYYKQCGVFCLPSYTEGFPYVILEAMSFGCPIIATDVGAIPEMLSNQSGIVVKPQNKEELKCAIQDLTKDHSFARLLGENAFKRVKQEYSINAIYEKYTNIWSDVLKHN